MRRFVVMLGIAIALGLGVVVSGLAMFLAPVAQVTTVTGGEPVTTTVAIPWVMVSMMLLGVIALLAIIVKMRRRTDAERRKRKHEDMTDPYLSAMADDGRLHLADDGELPEWIDDLAEEKEKRG
jgi:uncharacterized membrane protein